MPAVPSVSVVMPTYNKQPETLEFSRAALRSLAKYSRMALQVIVVDNASPAGCVSREWLNGIGFYDVAVLRFTENRGFGKAFNAGLQFARAEHVCQMNTDCELVEDTLSILLEAMDLHALDVAFPESWDNCRHYGLRKDQRLMTAEWRFGAFWLARTSIIRMVHGFDEQFELCYWEDTDLWKRLEAEGCFLAGYRGTWVKHVGGASSLPNRDEVFERNRRRFEEKWKLRTN